jgi:hypothetical protein
VTKAEAVFLVAVLSGVNMAIYLHLGLVLNLIACGACFITIAVILTA